MLFEINKYENGFIDGKIDIIRIENTNSVDPHSHQFLEFFYIESGSAVHKIDNQTSILKAGDYLVVDYNTIHEYISDSGFTIVNCLFTPELLDPAFKSVSDFNDLAERFILKTCRMKISSPSSNQIFHDTDGTIGAIFAKMVKEYNERQTGCLEILRCLISELIIETVRNVGSDTTISPLIEYVLKTIQENYSTQLSLADICQKKHYSLPYLSSKFKAETGMTFTQYLQNKRIEKSCELLAETSLNVTDIASKIGYGDIKFFNKVFKQTTKMTPREYRSHSKSESRR